MSEFILPFEQLSRADIARVGGKGANLGEMTRAGLPVPEGFCVTTEAYDAFVEGCPEARSLMAEADELEAGDLEGIRRVGAALRERLEAAPVPDAVTHALRAAFAEFPADTRWAVRSSATLEDLAEASFAGQQDTYLNVSGEAALLDRVRACWASLFTDRAISYRRQKGFGSSAVKLSVVVQRMVQAELSGIMFTANPLTGHRGQVSIDASYGLGEALVSGIVEPDNFLLEKVDGTSVHQHLGAKSVQIVSTPEGTEERPTPESLRAQFSLNDAQLRELLELAKTVEAHYESPQDIEWCIEGGELYLVQSRPITTLYPLPRPTRAGLPSDEGRRVYVSFGHVQVMTAPMRPLGIDTIAHLWPVGKPDVLSRSEVIREAGGRIYFDATPAMLRKPLRSKLPQLMLIVDPTMSRMLQQVVARPDFLRDNRAPKANLLRFARQLAFPVFRKIAANMLWRDPDANRRKAEAVVEAIPARFKRELDAAPDDLARLATFRRMTAPLLLELIPRLMHIVATGVISWKLLRRRFDDDPCIEDLTRGLDGNATTQMDLELGDIADVARAHPELAARLRERPRSLLEADALAGIAGAKEVHAKWTRFIERYGHRAAGEIDLTTTRWRDDPSSLLQSISGMLASEEVGAHRKQHEAAARQAQATGEALVARAGFGRRWWVRRLVHRMRVGLSLREHPKFMLMRCLNYGRDALVDMAGRLVDSGRLTRPDDLWWLNFDEIEAALRGEDFRATAAERQAAYRAYEHLRPPRILTSWGEVPTLPRDPNLPANAHAGTSASGGVIEGTARVILDPTTEVLHDGEILVAPFTDPGWTPLFIHASALVMEVGGLMTHGSVVAREYGIPAVVGLENATTVFRDGDRIRVDGDTGVVTLLERGGGAT